MTPNVVVFAYSQLGYESVQYLLKTNRASLAGLFTHRPSPHENIWFRPVADLGKQAGIPVWEDADLKSEDVFSQIQRLNPTLILSFYYRNLIPERILALASIGAFNLHGSLLPKYRGCAPVNWAIINGEHTTGVTLHRMVRKADAGDIVDQEAVPIEFEDIALTVMGKLCGAAVKVLTRQYDPLLTGTFTTRPQNEAEATYFRRRTPEDGRIDWTRSAVEIYNQIRALTHPYPGAWTSAPGQDRLFIWKAVPIPSTTVHPPGTLISEHPLRFQTGDGVLEVTDFSRG
jgi:methionyl-tRNA formyltransferase